MKLNMLYILAKDVAENPLPCNARFKPPEKGGIIMAINQYLIYYAGYWIENYPPTFGIWAKIWRCVLRATATFFLLRRFLRLIRRTDSPVTATTDVNVDPIGDASIVSEDPAAGFIGYYMILVVVVSFRCFAAAELFVLHSHRTSTSSLLQAPHFKGFLNTLSSAAL